MTYTTFKTTKENHILEVTFDYPLVNIQDVKMLDDLNLLAQELEKCTDTKVVIFKSSNPEIFVAHADTNFLKDISTTAVALENVELSYLQTTLKRINELSQVTIAQIEGYCRGGGNEFALACDMRFADIDKAIFMQMEVGMGILPCGGGASRLSRLTGIGRALEIILSGRDFNAKEAQKYGMINKAFKKDDLHKYVNDLSQRIAQFPFGSIKACKKAIYASSNLTINEALKHEAFWLYQATSTTPAIKRFTIADETGFEYKMENQRNFEQALIDLQEIE
ncbi:MAG: enoyl-CoA hydratase/isomerase family protein [Candidatus Gastranaerophilales bacterium]